MHCHSTSSVPVTLFLYGSLMTISYHTAKMNVYKVCEDIVQDAENKIIVLDKRCVLCVLYGASFVPYLFVIRRLIILFINSLPFTIVPSVSVSSSQRLESMFLHFYLLPLQVE